MQDNSLVIIDYGAGNIGSVINMFRRVGRPCRVSSSSKDIQTAAKIVIPGVGHFDHGMEQLKRKGLLDVLNHAALERRIPVLGICLGMQMMTRGSEEGTRQGLRWIEADVKKFKGGASGYRVPHMGWNSVAFKKSTPLVAGLDAEPYLRFYFVHSYYVHCLVQDDVLMTTPYMDEFVSAFQRGNIMGVQFHPEKSHRYGMMLLKNFGDL